MATQDVVERIKANSARAMEATGGWTANILPVMQPGGSSATASTCRGSTLNGNPSVGTVQIILTKPPPMPTWASPLACRPDGDADTDAPTGRRLHPAASVTCTRWSAGGQRQATQAFLPDQHVVHEGPERTQAGDSPAAAPRRFHAGRDHDHGHDPDNHHGDDRRHAA
ncbi:MAG: hypothetical protein R3E96_03535 [Planctomycetota bacterium]